MPNVEFIARNGIVSRGNLVVSGSVISTSPASFSGSLSVTGSISAVGSGSFGYSSIASGNTYIKIDPNQFNSRITFNDFDGGIGSRGGELEMSTYYSRLTYGAYNWFYIGIPNVPYIFYIGDNQQVLISKSPSKPDNATAMLQVKGTGTTSSTTSFLVQNSTPVTLLQVEDGGTTRVAGPTPRLMVNIPSNQTPTNTVTIGGSALFTYDGYSNAGGFYIDQGGTSNASRTIWYDGVGTVKNLITGNGNSYITAGNLGIGTSTPSASLHISGSSNSALFEIDSPAVNNIIFVSGSGNVGIGTGTPTSRLTVAGNIDLGSNFIGNGTTQYVHCTGGSGEFRFKNGNGGGWYYTWCQNSSDGLAERMRLSTSNNLLIGTTSDSARLTVQGSGATSSTTSFLVQNSSGTTLLQTLDDATTTLAGKTFTGTGTILVPAQSHSASDVVMKGDSALISANGNANQWGKIVLCDAGAGTTYQNYSLGHAFKIGTTSPITYLTINSNLITTGPSTRIQMGAQDASDIYQATNTNFYGSFLPFGSTGNTVFKNSYTLGAYQFFTAPSVDGTLVEALRIAASGNVGIGKTTPTYKLDVSGSGNFTSNLTITGSLTVITGSSIEFQVNQTGVKIGNAATDSHSISGSVSISGSAGSGSALYAYKSGSTVLDIQGSQGQLFSVIDALSGSLMSVNDISGLPIVEVFSDDRVVMGTYGAPGLTVSGSTAAVATGSSAPTGTAPEGTFRFAVAGGLYYIYAYIGGAWRSGSLA